MKPPIVYEVTNPSAHMIKRITKIVQSMVQLLSDRQPLTLDHLQVIDDLSDALYLPGNRSSARLLLGGLDFAGEDHNAVVGLDANTGRGVDPLSCERGLHIGRQGAVIHVLSRGCTGHGLAAGDQE